MSVTTAVTVVLVAGMIIYVVYDSCKDDEE